MVTGIMCMVVIAILAIDYRRNKQIVSPFSIIAIPYIIIVLINNIYAVKKGFYAISDKVIIMVLAALILFYFGVFFSDMLYPPMAMANDSNVELKLQHYRIESSVKYVIFCELLIGARAVMTIRSNGILFLANNEGYMLSGTLGHLLLTIVPLLPLLLLYWLNNKKEVIYLLAAILGYGLLFSTFVKYHLIGIVIATYLFISFSDKRYETKGAVALVIISVAIFIMNYVVTFFTSGTISQVSSTFYFNHLWKYISGGMIYDNHIFTEGVYEDSVPLRIGSVIFAFPNMFLNRFFRATVFESQRIPAIVVASNGELTNVVDAIGYFFPSKGDIWELFLWSLIMIVNGFITTRLYWRARNRSNRLPFSFSIYGAYFVFLSFFAIFARLETPWEMILWSIIMSTIFDKRFSIKRGVVSFRNDLKLE